MNYVLPNLMGRLGNNMFMIAHAYARSKELNIPLIITRNQVRYEGNDYSQNIFRKLNFIEIKFKSLRIEYLKVNVQI